MTTRTMPAKALVLGGGGIAGIAWECGLLSALLDAGIGLDAADLVIGTSAGSVVATLLRSGAFASGRVRQMLAGLAAEAGEGAPRDAGAGDFDADRYARLLEDAARGATSHQDARARLGAVAQRVPVALSQPEWIGQIRGMLPPVWPDAPLGVTAIDATTGALSVFDAASGVDLALAVAASCTVPGAYPLVDIDRHPFMDGGMRSATNADLAAGCRRVLVVACSEEPGTSPYGPTLPEALDQVRREGEALLVQADADSRTAFGTNSLDPATSVPSFAAGQAQAASVLEVVRTFWDAPLE